MSWYIEVVGKRADVKAAIQKEEHIPQCVKDVVSAFCDSGPVPPPEYHAGIRVKSSGHFSTTDSGSSINELVIAPIKFVASAPDTPTTTA